MSSSATTPTPFRISIPDTQLSLLHQKLSLATFPDELEGADKKYGARLSDVQRLTKYWENGFDWRKVENELNDTLPMFTQDVEVDGHGVLNVHFVWKESERKADAIPLLFVHGCESFSRHFFDATHTQNSGCMGACLCCC
jgi:hypothetical protein